MLIQLANAVNKDASLLKTCCTIANSSSIAIPPTHSDESIYWSHMLNYYAQTNAQNTAIVELHRDFQSGSTGLYRSTVHIVLDMNKQINPNKCKCEFDNYVCNFGNK